MSRYFETIKVQNGELLNLCYHQQRFQRTRREEMGLKNHPALAEVISVPGGLEQGLFKCRVIYGKEIELIEYEPYIKKEIRSLKLVRSDTITYGCKTLDRSVLEDLYRQRGKCDDILIVSKGSISDTSYSNVLFMDGSRWLTPDRPLLPGTMRASLIADGRVTEEHITPDDLGKFQSIKLINAMNNFQDGTELAMEAISW
jgi:4-amino-4-deoxychorismate lyase